MVTIDPATQDFILQQVVPTVGLITGTFMTFAPYRAVLKASKDGNLGDLNPTPWVFMLGNCCGWVAYSFLIQNVYIFLGNAPAFILAIWLNIQAIKLQYENHRSSELQTSIIKALEDLKSSATSKKNSNMITKDEAAAIFGHVVDEGPAVDLLDPVNTAPLVDGEAHQESNTSTGPTTAYSSIASNNNADDMNEAEQGIFSLSLRRNSSIMPPAVQEATGMLVDYASLVWDIAAQRSPAPASHELMVLGISAFWLCLFTVVVFSQQVWAKSTRLLLVGVAVNANLIFFYGAPLSKIATVLETKTSKLIHVPTMIFSLMNGALWFVYGLAVSDPFIAVPNGFGAVLGIIQVILCLMFPRHSHHHLGEEGAVGIFKSALSRDNSSSTGSISLPKESTPLI